MIDVTPPLIACLAGLTIDATSPDGAQGDFPLPAATGNCGKPEVSCTPPSDPRVRDGRQYPLWAILTVIALGLLLGRKHLSQIIRDGQRLSQGQRHQIGFRRRRGTKFIPTPCYNVYREVLRRIDLSALAAVLTQWLSAHRDQLPATLAYDGKTIRDRLGLIVTLLDVEEGVPVAHVPSPFQP